MSQWGTEISFPLVCESFPCHPAGPNNTKMNISTPAELSQHRQNYANLAKTFDPVSFNATNMAKLAKAAGFKYLVYTTVHCDGFMNWPSNLTDYTIANTPWGAKGRGTYAELVQAFRAEGLKVGAYVCPSMWNNDSYWAPDALRSPGPVCKPNYAPESAAGSAKWKTFNTFLHGLVTELVDLYAPDTFWFDCMNAPPDTDTHLEAVLDKMRSANPNVVINIRNGMWSDYTESGDQQEALAQTIFGIQQEYVGDYFEIPAVMQESRQWAYDPKSGQKPTSEFLANLIMLTAKNGNYLMNVAPDPQGVWPAAALQTFEELAGWMAINGEAIHGTRPVWPYQYGNVFVTSSEATQAIYVLIPARKPDSVEAVDMVSPAATSRASSCPSAVPTGAAGSACGEQQIATNPLHTALRSGSQKYLTLPWLRPSLFAKLPSKVELLGGSANITFKLTDAAGMNITGISDAVDPFDCTVFGCTCKGMGNYYGIGPAPGCGVWGCAPSDAQAWWMNAMDCQVGDYATSAVHPGCGDKKCSAPTPPPGPVLPEDLGLVLKISF